MEHVIFPEGGPVPASYFTGTVTARPLSNEPAFNVAILNIQFAAGARTNWHTHPGGQILLVTEGEGWYQEKDSAAQLIRKGDVINIAPGVEHWHGAAHDCPMTHIAVNTNTDKGMVEWLGPVTDGEYDSVR